MKSHMCTFILKTLSTKDKLDCYNLSFILYIDDFKNKHCEVLVSCSDRVAVKSCQKLSFAVKISQKISKDVKRCQKMSKDVKRCQKMSKDVKRCQKISKDVKRCQKMS